MATETLTAKDVLLRAADYIEKHGWTQQTYENAEGACCFWGACNKVREAAEMNRYYLDDQIMSCFRRVAPSHNCPVAYNDAVGRTKDEVVAVMRKAAEVCE